jgi:hypothetical protein
MDNTKITRLEVINENGRLVVLYDVKVELSYQDDDRTLKIFVKDKCKDESCDSVAENGIDYCATHSPYLRNTSTKAVEKVGKVRI